MVPKWTFSLILAKGIKCYECDGGIYNQCKNNDDWGTLKTCDEGTTACIKSVTKWGMFQD